ncbi:hypothetical protein M758_10G017900, partial [Ceratodon purpureus]
IVVLQNFYFSRDICANLDMLYYNCSRLGGYRRFCLYTEFPSFKHLIGTQLSVLWKRREYRDMCSTPDLLGESPRHLASTKMSVHVCTRRKYKWEEPPLSHNFCHCNDPLSLAHFRVRVD